MSKNSEQDFWNKVDRSGGPESCWNWTGRIYERGQGQFSINGKIWRTIPLAYYLANKKLPEMTVTICKNPACCNPKHIRSVSKKEYDLQIKGNTEEDFWKLVDIKGANDCWLWTGHCSPSGYGIAQWRNSPRRAHRLAYTYKNGSLKKDDLILHSCHERRCCNPSHLKAGTHRDNMRDMVLAKRSAVGSKNGNSRLTADRVLSIREEYRVNKTPQRKLARKHNTTQTTISEILSNKTWKHL